MRHRGGIVIPKILICKNPSCRFVLDLREGGRTTPRSSLIINCCPDCASDWLDYCPFCSAHLDISWEEELPHCAACHRSFRPVPPHSSDAKN